MGDGAKLGCDGRSVLEAYQMRHSTRKRGLMVFDLNREHQDGPRLREPQRVEGPTALELARSTRSSHLLRLAEPRSRRSALQNRFSVALELFLADKFAIMCALYWHHR